MSKNLVLKQQTVAEIKEKFEKAASMVIVEYRGISVEQVTELRKQYRAAGVEYVVLKNTLVKRALSELNIEGLDEHLEGPNAFAFSYEDPVAPAKILCDFISKTKNEHLKVKAGYMDGKAMDVETVKALAALPSKDVLIGMFVGVLAAPMRALACVIDAIRKQKAGETEE